ncbi:MAG: hypothetical protein EOQ28_22240 [Mesorhizobium sp.]|uniref:hypothetical protein n=1 Tax=Mesorhizobium sp. TaxID=1871066 RepID=UPI000FE94724|nr:hypothetical protein [Mesorhizobium sp.]RWA69954.1 MAG: hypothetical protein EOQ28_22240 [Mesorhizobium sp.]RWB94502.1 MAG: hypothetical protein EOQ57_31665 [Mesorhizobium sp.]
MTTTELTQAGQVSPGRKSIVRSALGGRRGPTTAGLAIAAGIAFNWSWLVAAGIAPVLLGLLPCLAMCALGLCMNRLAGRPCQAGDDSAREGADSPKALSADMKGTG